MKLWNDLTEKEQEVVIQFCVEIYNILDEAIITPLTELFDDLSFFFIAAEGVMKEEIYWKKKDEIS